MTRLLDVFRLAFLTLVFLVGAAWAQTVTDAPDYDAWAQVATRAEAALEDQRASDTAFQTLRDELAEWRTSFLDAQSINAARIDTLREQIAALGAVPEDGSESEEIAARRAELTDQLNRLLAPRLTAEEAYSRADGLIREIDSILRERQADQLLELGPSPLNPVHWPETLSALGVTLKGIWDETVAGWTSEAQQAERRENLPQMIGYLILAGLLVIRGREWMERSARRFRETHGRRSRKIVGFCLSLGQVLLPVAGLYALIEALTASGLTGFRGQIVADHLPLLGLTLFGAWWLGMQLFPKSAQVWTILEVAPERRAEARLHSVVLGVVIGIEQLLEQIAIFDGYTDGARVVLIFPLQVIAAINLVRLGQVLRGAAAAEGEAHTLAGRVIDVLGRLTLLVGIGAPLAIALGYAEAGSALMRASILTMALLGLLVVLFRVVSETYELVTGKSEDAVRDALVPVLVGLALTVAALPVFALIWGARLSDLTELWARFREGFALGETRISPSDFLLFVVVFVIGYVLTRLVKSGLQTSVLPKTKIDKGGQNAIAAGVSYLGIFLSAVIAITTAGIDLSSLAIVAGALSVGIGFGLQNIVSNFVSGIILLIERPISEGDWIEVGGQMGHVRDISVRSTRIETFDRTDVIVPNADLVSGQVTNYTRGNLIGRAIIKVGVAYGSDTRRIEDILREIASDHPLVALNPPPSVYFIGFGADSLDFEIRAILRDVNFLLQVKSDMNHAIAERFAAEGIEIPFAQRDIWLRNPEALSQLAPKALSGEGTDVQKAGANTEAQAYLDAADMPDTGGDGSDPE